MTHGLTATCFPTSCGTFPTSRLLRAIGGQEDNVVGKTDNCWDYNGGDSERRMGKALRDGYREQPF